MSRREQREDLDGENNGGQREQEKESNSRGEKKFIEKEGKLREERERPLLRGSGQNC